jgi:hypothetical protein
MVSACGLPFLGGCVGGDGDPTIGPSESLGPGQAVQYVLE